jgi:hypothetical protein
MPALMDTPKPAAETVFSNMRREKTGEPFRKQANDQVSWGLD